MEEIRRNNIMNLMMFITWNESLIFAAFSLRAEWPALILYRRRIYPVDCLCRFQIHSASLSLSVLFFSSFPRKYGGRNLKPTTVFYHVHLWSGVLSPPAHNYLPLSRPAHNYLRFSRPAHNDLPLSRPAHNCLPLSRPGT